MNKIVKKQILAKNVKLIEVENKQIADKILPGQFVILRINETGERIPLTIVTKDIVAGTITLVFQEIGKTTISLGKLEPGDSILDIVGPLGIPTEIKKHGSPVVIVSGGVGTAEVLPVAKSLKEQGNKIITILGARNKELLIFENELKSCSDKFYITTDDGSYGEKGLVTDILKKLISSGTEISMIYAVGPIPMMYAVSELTRQHKIHTMVSLNPVMVDGTGMCGSCRITIGNETKCACVDGPEFDGHLVDWKELAQRIKLFTNQEKVSLSIIQS